MEQGKIDHAGFYVQGDIKFAVDATDAHKTFDAVAALSNADKIKLAKLNNIPAEPFNKQALTTILKSVVQNAWFANKVGSVPAEVQAAHAARLTRYTTELAVPSSLVDFLSRKTRAVSETRKVLLYTIDPEKYEANWKEYRSQAYLTIKTLIDLGGVNGVGKSVRDIYDNCNETRETTKPTKNAIGQILNRLSTAGIVRCLNPEDARKVSPKKGAPAAPKAATPSKQATKKK
jgi:hypothetical protein